MAVAELLDPQPGERVLIWHPRPAARRRTSPQRCGARIVRRQ